jgi:hypothetical protein
VSENVTAHKTRADKLLADPEVQKLMSDALRVLLELRAADGCAKKAAMLDRVAKHGDERSAAILRPLTAGKRRGCGFLQLQACPAPCGKDAPAMLRAIKAIESRTARDKATPQP